MYRITSTLLLAGSLVSAPLAAQELEITVRNVTHGIYFTPLLIAAHGHGTHLFQPGTAASAHLQAMAEGGDIAGLSADLDTVGADKVENPVGGMLAPGAATTTQLSTASGNGYLSLTAMLLPTNDGFVGLDALPIPTDAGTYTYTLNAYDAGTEANDEIVNGGAAPGTPGIPADPGGYAGSGATGVTHTEANDRVHIHPGVLGDTEASGGMSDLDSRAHRWLNPVAELVITVQ